ncbi:acyl-CoA-binding protein [Flavobacterium agricola]|uniref:Acyl-CoA-binding protein n=1 Tax=Flavobacterium agricola TaxID=2870839 RepID=A0ABY6LZW2_9FLAO|nr:acyl-CoA-binding protein [Flavobacterium agricola]UYW01835.1 acyl-CoA-binding protein [Flavobacterium agricola]
MTEQNLDIEFKKYFDLLNTTLKQSDVPQDIQLLLYGLYKQATLNEVDAEVNLNDAYSNLIHAFKLNAWLQVKHLSPSEAKNAYIEQVKKLL